MAATEREYPRPKSSVLKWSIQQAGRWVRSAANLGTVQIAFVDHEPSNKDGTIRCHYGANQVLTYRSAPGSHRSGQNWPGAPLSSVPFGLC